MAYMHAYTAQSHPAHFQPVQFPQFGTPQQSPYNGFYNPYSAEYADFGSHGSMQDDYEEGTENLTRPRLTKEQVDVLEAQFQAHPKPNSMVKRQLALQTKLTLPRVAVSGLSLNREKQQLTWIQNWFQNRRAKAKQQRKQEEFEVNNHLGSLQEGWQSESSLPHRPADTVEESAHIKRERSFTESSFVPSSSSTGYVHKSPEEITKDKTWESLQRVLDARKQAAQQDQTSMPPPALPRQIQTQVLSPPKEHIPSAASVSAFPDWSSVASATPWSTVQPSIEEFNFGFEPLQEEMSSGSEHTPTGNQDNISTQGYSIDGDWTEVLHHPVPMQQPVQFAQLDSSAMQDAAYLSSRRGSTSDELTTNFNSFALAATASPPITHFPAPQRSDSGESVDLATRRKQKRPATLGSAAIRSRSYGTLSSISPTLRAHSQMPGSHSIRHVKSTGYGLNARYAGIRKTSSAQRSPLNVASFAEAEAYKRLMAQQPLLEGSNEGTCNNTPLMSPEVPMDSQMSAHLQHAFYPQEMPASAQYPPSASTYYSTFQSPPVTPFRPDYYMPSQQPSLMPPISAGLQYASFPDQTPPYSAGPLTSSSWSDAPLTSPDMATFQLMSHMPSMAYPISTDMATGQYRHFMASPDKPEISPTLSEQKKTEFFMHEFPGQKEEHAHVAQQLAQQKPKSYVFANATPNDY
jgi:hypothetical protein